MAVHGLLDRHEGGAQLLGDGGRQARLVDAQEQALHVLVGVELHEPRRQATQRYAAAPAEQREALVELDDGALEIEDRPVRIRLRRPRRT